MRVASGGLLCEGYNRMLFLGVVFGVAVKRYIPRLLWKECFFQVNSLQVYHPEFIWLTFILHDYHRLDVSDSTNIPQLSKGEQQINPLNPGQTFFTLHQPVRTETNKQENSTTAGHNLWIFTTILRCFQVIEAKFENQLICHVPQECRKFRLRK